jgi:hypothetical protein
VIVAATAAIAGCGSGGGGGKASSGQVGTPAPTGGGSSVARSLEVMSVAGLPATYSIRFDVKDAPVHVLDVKANGGDMVVKAIRFIASGSIDESVDVSGIKVAVDDGDGKFDKTRDPYIGGVARFPTNDGAAIVGGLNHTVKAGTPALFWVVMDLAGSAQPGETVQVAIDAAVDVDAIDATRGVAAQVTGLPALSPVGVVYLNDHLVLSEIMSNGSAEFIEIYNPTPRTVDLSNVFLTDGEERPQVSPTTGQMYGADKHYYNVPKGTAFGGNSSFDFHARFPQGAQIPAGGFVTVALSGDNFKARFGKDPSFELGSDTDSIPNMSWVGTAPTSATYTPTLSNDREIVVLYSWDGTSDKVVDLDIVQYGDSIMGFYVDKSAESVDGPDQDTAPSAYKADTGWMNQDKVPVSQDFNKSIARIDFAEAGEDKAGGNGLVGHDETSETLSITWGAASPTPGAK